MVGAAARKLGILLEEIDGNGLFPLRAVERTFLTAYAFRRELQRNLPQHLGEHPKANPFRGVKLPPRPSIPREILDLWPEVTASVLAGELDSLPIDHSVAPVTDRGGAAEAKKRLRKFLTTGLDDYGNGSNHPEKESTSRISPYLHFGNLSAHQVFHALARSEGWSTDHLSNSTAGKRAGWWGMSSGAEAFLDQLVTWRELGYNFCSKRDDYQEFQSLPPWAIETLTQHAKDERPHLYTQKQFETARTHDPLWNAAQNQLRQEGHIHNYLRMLWGKKILEWSASPEDAMKIMIALNDRYAVDGRDPNSYSGISWVLGRYDRPWGPERAIFGKIRYMSSANTARKFTVKNYTQRWGTQPWTR
jgi:deoxyribodipyrimidine photo-lyase